MLDAYRLEREKRLKDETRSKQVAGALVIGGLQKRLLSSIEAFAKILAVHRKSVERTLEKAMEAIAVSAELQANLERLTVGEKPTICAELPSPSFLDGRTSTQNHSVDLRWPRKIGQVAKVYSTV